MKENRKAQQWCMKKTNNNDVIQCRFIVKLLRLVSNTFNSQTHSISMDRFETTRGKDEKQNSRLL